MLDVQILLPALTELITLTPTAQRLFVFCLHHHPVIQSYDIPVLAAGLGVHARSVQRSLRQIARTKILSRCILVSPRQRVRLLPYSDSIKVLDNP